MGILRYLQGWIGVISLMALGNTISCFRDHRFLAEHLYTSAPSEVNGLMARLFGIWTLLASIVRLYCAIHIRNKQVYNLTFISFVVVIIHFLSEIFYYKTAAINIGVLLPLIFAGFTVIWMIIGYRYLDETQTKPDDDTRRRKMMSHRKAD